MLYICEKLGFTTIPNVEKVIASQTRKLLQETIFRCLGLQIKIQLKHCLVKVIMENVTDKLLEYLIFNLNFNYICNLYRDKEPKFI